MFPAHFELAFYLCPSRSGLGQDGVEVLDGEGHVLDAVAVHRQMLAHLHGGLRVRLVTAVQCSSWY